MTKKQRKTEYSRLRGDSGHMRRILAVMAVLGLTAFIPVSLRLYSLMVSDYDYYSRLALRNQTRTTSVTADRGTIYDRNMNILATSVSVENVYLDPHELKQAGEDIGKISATLGEILEKAGLRVFNSPRAIAVCDDKATTFLALSKSGLKFPKTITVPLCYTKGAKPSAEFLAFCDEVKFLAVEFSNVILLSSSS